MKKALGVLFGFLCAMFVPLIAAGAEAKTKAEPQRPEVMIDPYRLPWVALAPGVQRAMLWGNPDGAYQAMVKVEKGTKTPSRTPPYDLRIVVLAGYMTLHYGSGETRMIFGTYLKQPAGLPLTVSCDPHYTCWWVEESLGKTP